MINKTNNVNDKDVEILWDEFSDILTDENVTIIKEDFYIWKKGTDIIDIWTWFNKNHSKGLRYLFCEYESEIEKSL